MLCVKIALNAEGTTGKSDLTVDKIMACMENNIPAYLYIVYADGAVEFYPIYVVESDTIITVDDVNVAVDVDGYIVYGG